MLGTTFARLLLCSTAIALLGQLQACAVSREGTVQDKAHFEAETTARIEYVQQQGVTTHISYFATPQPVLRYRNEPECWGLLFKGTWHCTTKTTWDRIEAGQRVRFRYR